MSDLFDTKKRYLSLFPSPLEGLDVVASPYLKDELHLHYVQRDTFDPRRNWEVYNKSIQQKVKPSANHFDPIYFRNLDLFDSGGIHLEDKLLLTCELNVASPQGDVYLGYLIRNKDPSLKGVGSLFFSHLSSWLKEKGHDTLFLIPLKEKTVYWEAQGFKQEFFYLEPYYATHSLTL